MSTKMNPEKKAMWASALRSGKYKQGRSRLRTGDRYCCLGVLVDLYLKEVGGEWEYSRNRKISDKSIAKGYDVIPNCVMERAEITPGHNNPVLYDCFDAVYCNDAMRLTFDQIADLIERNL